MPHEPKSLKNSPPPPDDWMDDVYGSEQDQAKLDNWRRKHNLKVLAQRKAFREYFGEDMEEYPDYQNEENA